MTKPPAKQRHLASSPFKPDPEPIIEIFEVDDVVSHDSYGLGKVVTVDTSAVMVDFGAQTVRVKSPFTKMEKL